MPAFIVQSGSSNEVLTVESYVESDWSPLRTVTVYASIPDQPAGEAVFTESDDFDLEVIGACTSWVFYDTIVPELVAFAEY